MTRANSSTGAASGPTLVIEMADTTTGATAGTRVTADPSQVLVVGRDRGCDVVCPAAEVSRWHLQLWCHEDTWWLRDLGSTGGTWQEDDRVEAMPLHGEVVLTLGRRHGGPVLRCRITDDDDAREEVGSAAAADHARQLLEWAEAAEAAGVDLSSTIRVAPDDPALQVHLDGHLRRFEPGTVVRMGRDPDVEVPISDPDVSRRHAEVRNDGTRWVMSDLGSEQGIFVHGQRVDERPLSGVTTVWLGRPGAGTRVVLLTSGETEVPPPTRAPHRLRWALEAALALAVVALVVGLLVVDRDGGGAPDVAELASATVRVEVFDGTPADGELLSRGSGTVIGDDGLVLTNAHVVEGHQRPDATIAISLHEGDDVPMRLAYEGEVAALDRYLDLAVVRLTERSDPEAPTVGDLTHVRLGDSDALEVGDDLWVLGHPVVTEALSVNVTSGSVGGFLGDALLGTPRAWVTSEAAIGRGSSGGLASGREGTLVAIPTQIWVVRDADGVERRSNRLRPVALARPLVEAVRSGRPYAAVEAPSVALDVAGRCEGRPGSSPPSGSATSSGVEEVFMVTGVPEGPLIHHRVLVDAGDGPVEVASGAVPSTGSPTCVVVSLEPVAEGDVRRVVFALDADFVQVLGELRR
ncbi:MAG: FHA domain-containing protein [Acidimicrobiia bacterium]|nr:FHA domain-containing protein [Acidimicrobiia bacterium]